MKTTKFFKNYTKESAIRKLVSLEENINYNTTAQRISKKMLNSYWIAASIIFSFNLKEIQKNVNSKLLNYNYKS